MVFSDNRYTIKTVKISNQEVASVYNIIKKEDDKILTSIIFQDGSPAESSTNGVLHEHLIQILIDRLEAIQKGPKNCVENEVQLAYLKKVLQIMKEQKEAYY